MTTPRESIEDVSYTAVIEAELSERRRRNPSYSLRSFAKFLGVSPASLSQILSGKRRLSPKIAARIAERCEFSPAKKSRFMSQVLETPLNGAGSRLEFFSLTPAEFAPISDWHYYAILSLAQLPGNHADASWVAARLGIDTEEAHTAIKRMVELGYLQIEEGRLMRTERRHLRVKGGEEEEAPLQKHHKQLFTKAAHCLERVPRPRRDISAITMAINPERLGEATELIQQFHHQVRELLSAGNLSDVYALQVSLFPLTTS